MSSLLSQKLMHQKMNSIKASRNDTDLLNRIKYVMISKDFSCKLIMEIVLQQSYSTNESITSILNKVDNIIIEYYGKDKSIKFNNYIKSKLFS